MQSLPAPTHVLNTMLASLRPFSSEERLLFGE